MARKMKRANGTGCVYQLKDKNRRNSWVARVTIGYNDKGYPIYIFLEDEKGNKYFPDRTIPDLLLAKYNIEKGNINLDKSNYTFSQVYEEYAEKNFPTKEEVNYEKKYHIKAKGKLGRSITNNLKAAYKKCEKLYNKHYKSLRKKDFEDIILNTVGCATVIDSLANLFRKLDNYALDQDIIVKGYADLIKITDDMYLPIQDEGSPYSYEEIDIIWEHQGELVTDITLSTIYTGARIEELLFTKREDVHLNENYFVAGLKTNAGKRRIIPIHSDIKHIFQYYYNQENDFLFTIDNEKIDYDTQFYHSYKDFMQNLNMNHNTHDGRKTLESEFDRVGANKICRDRIIGHRAGNTGDDVYTKKGIEELIETIEMINYRSKKGTKITYFKAL